MNLQERYPLQVICPFSGQFLLLNWRTYNEGGHIALARTESQLQCMIDTVNQKYGVIDSIDAFMQVELLST